MHDAVAIPSLPAGLCQACGACCSFAAEWPRFSLEDDAQLDAIPARFVAADGSGMRCDGVRCSALGGEIGQSTACGIYGLRPDVCRACMPGDPECLMARTAHGLAPVAPCDHAPERSGL